MAVEAKLSDQEIASLMEIPHPSKGPGESIYEATKVFPDYQAEPGETYLGMGYTWGSGRFSGIARDAEYLAELVELGASPHGAHGAARSAADVVR